MVLDMPYALSWSRKGGNGDEGPCVEWSGPSIAISSTYLHYVQLVDTLDIRIIIIIFITNGTRL